VSRSVEALFTHHLQLTHQGTTDELSFGQGYPSEQIGKRVGMPLEGYDQFGIVVRGDTEDWPFFIAWNAVLQIQSL
jgi:hypothetical protein